jgi:hypothetical protein
VISVLYISRALACTGGRRTDHSVYLEAAEDEDGDADGLVAVGAGKVVVELEPDEDADKAEHEADALHGDVRVEPEGVVALEVASQHDPHRHQHAPPEPGQRAVPLLRIRRPSRAGRHTC